ncbi:MAG: helix-hairpin-helix domain-containing protein [Bacteroidetes bacterium]|nr:helix-hairpin-helix domain-containing protein [Bacteroidota bacterium]
MGRLRAWFRNVFGFTRSQTNGMLVLIPLMIIIIFSEPLYRSWYVRQPQDYSREGKELDSVIALMKWSKPDSVASAEALHFAKTSFNPNTATQEQLLSLGFPRPLATRLLNYRNKGGKFLVKSDLLKIYGMDSSFYSSLKKYIDLPVQIAKPVVVQHHEEKPRPAVVKFDLNSTDTSQLIKIYGIGVKLSARIVAYREKLGGFVSFQQLSEVYALDTAAIRELKSKSFIREDFQPAQLNLNKASEKELAAHPYIKYKLAKTLAAYRLQHGPFQRIEQLKEIVTIDEAKFKKIKPYLSVNP